MVINVLFIQFSRNCSNIHRNLGDWFHYISNTQSLYTDIERRYNYYLSGDSRVLRLQITLVCSLLVVGLLIVTLTYF